MSEIGVLWIKSFLLGGIVSGTAYVVALLAILGAEVSRQEHWRGLRARLRAFLRCRHVQVPRNGELAIIRGELEPDCLGSLRSFVGAQSQAVRMSARVGQLRDWRVGLGLVFTVALVFATIVAVLSLVQEKPVVLADAMWVFGLLVTLLCSLGVAVPVLRANAEIGDLVTVMAEAENQATEKVDYLSEEEWKRE